ncbi:MAG TPA: signal peptidase II [Polyangiaceae bacterium]
MSETSPETHAETDVVGVKDELPQSPPPDAEVTTAAPAELAVEEPIPGDRLGVPFGATRVIAEPGRPRPSYVFLALVSILTLAADLGSKAWAENHLDGNTVSEVVKNHLTLILAKNRGGAWGLLQSTSENVRRPFFLLVSVAAIAFIMTLYRRLNPRQRALKWGLPLVLGGALGNVFDRIRYGHVIDFIDYRADWMRILNEKLLHNSNDHWPTFNIADVAICVGVGLMAIDMFTSKRGQRPVFRAPAVPPSQSGEPSPDWAGWQGQPPAPLAVAEPPPADVPPAAPETPGDAPPAGTPPTE